MDKSTEGKCRETLFPGLADSLREGVGFGILAVFTTKGSHE